MRPRIPLLIATIAAVTAALVPGQAAAAPAPAAASQNFLDPLRVNLSTAELSPADQARLDAITAHLPANWQERLAHVRSEFDIESSGVEEVVAAAIDPTLYECQPTAFSNYANSLLEGVDLGTLLILLIRCRHRGRCFVAVSSAAGSKVGWSSFCWRAVSASIGMSVA